MLLLLHPFMPFITEELWQQLAEERSSLLILAEWPNYDDALLDAGAAAEMDWVVRLITGIRSVRSEMNVPAAAKIPMLLTGADKRAQAWLEEIGRAECRERGGKYV